MVLAIDLMNGQIVHGMKGNRSTYRPFVHSHYSFNSPIEFLTLVAPRFLYIADLDRIQGQGSNDPLIWECVDLVERCYIDRGCRSTDDYLEGKNIVNIVGTETGGSDLSKYKGGLLSIDIKEEKVIPTGIDPSDLLFHANSLNFDGCIILNLGAIGTVEGIPEMKLKAWRSSYKGFLMYGGGIGHKEDLYVLNTLNYDGAILATAIHQGIISLEWIREGTLC